MVTHFATGFLVVVSLASATKFDGSNDGQGLVQKRTKVAGREILRPHQADNKTVILSGNTDLAAPTPQPTPQPTPAPTLGNGLTFSLRALDSTDSVATDSVSQVAMTPKPIVTHEGHHCWNLDSDEMPRASGTQLTLGQYYTEAFWVYWRASDSTWRTLSRGSQDHNIIIHPGSSKQLGMFSNRNGGYRGSGYSITNDMSSWQLVIVTGQGDSATGSSGTSTFYTAAEGETTVTMRGTADRVASGMHQSKLGWDNQGPGKVAAWYQWDRVLTVGEMNLLLARGVDAGADATQAAVPTPQPTPQPTPGTTSGAFGDPHCVNAAGEWFDIHASGQIPMVILPRGANPEDADLAVVATTATPEGFDKCAATFISAVDVLAYHNSQRMLIDYGAAEKLEVKRVKGPGDAYSVDVEANEVTVKAQSFVLKVILKKVPVPGAKPFMYIDMEVAGLQTAKAGGVLGEDSHELVEKLPAGCTSDAVMMYRASSAKAV